MVVEVEEEMVVDLVEVEAMEEEEMEEVVEEVVEAAIPKRKVYPAH